MLLICSYIVSFNQAKKNKTPTFSIADFKENWNVPENKSARLGKEELINHGYLKEDEYGQIIFDANGDLED